jgi:hypothetical protein
MRAYWNAAVRANALDFENQKLKAQLESEREMNVILTQENTK